MRQSLAMVSSQKRVIVRRFSRDWLAGFVSQRHFVSNGSLELLDVSGKRVSPPLSEIKMVSFVRDFGPAGATDPERLGRRNFSGRPRTPGLMVRLRFRDNEILEGLVANDLSLLENEGILLTPPDTRSNTQRIYIPRLSIAEMEVLGIIKARTSRKPPGSIVQEDLFGSAPITGSRPN
jgi:hypothetical protein